MKYQNIAAIWKKTDKNGQTYLSLKVESDLKAGDSVNLFKNEKQGNESRPDFRAYKKIDDESTDEGPTSKEVAEEIPF